MARPDILTVLTDSKWRRYGDAWTLVQEESHIQVLSPYKEANKAEEIENQKRELSIATMSRIIASKPDMVIINSEDPEFGHGLAHNLIDQLDFPAKNLVLVEASTNDFRYRKIARELGVMAVSYKGFLQLLAGVDLDKIRTT